MINHFGKPRTGGPDRAGRRFRKMAASARHGLAAYQLPRQRLALHRTPAAMFIAQANRHAAIVARCRIWPAAPKAHATYERAVCINFPSRLI